MPQHKRRAPLIVIPFRKPARKIDAPQAVVDEQRRKLTAVTAEARWFVEIWRPRIESFDLTGALLNEIGGPLD
jgi:hypothetical protein